MGEAGGRGGLVSGGGDHAPCPWGWMSQPHGRECPLTGGPGETGWGGWGMLLPPVTRLSLEWKGWNGSGLLLLGKVGRTVMQSVMRSWFTPIWSFPSVSPVTFRCLWTTPRLPLSLWNRGQNYSCFTGLLDDQGTSFLKGLWGPWSSIIVFSCWRLSSAGTVNIDPAAHQAPWRTGEKQSLVGPLCPDSDPLDLGRSLCRYSFISFPCDSEGIPGPLPLPV